MTRGRGRNGGAIGAVRTTTDSLAQTGIWGLYDAHQLKSNDTWGTPPVAPEFNWRYYAYGTSIGTTSVYWLEDNGTINTLRSIAGQQHTNSTSTWNSYTEDLSSYSGTTGRIYIGYRTGNNFYNDPQFDNMELTETTSGTIDLDPGTSTGRGRWNRRTAYTTGALLTSSYSSIPIGTGAANLWNYDRGGTPSGSTGSTADADGSTSGYYLYFEGSSPNYTGGTRVYWVRMTSSYTLL
jgi:hypothetical protein